jgi:hypothetical protein
MVVTSAPSCMTASVRQENDALAVEQDGARSTGSLIAALLGTREIERFAQDVEQRLPRIEFKLPSFAVDGQLDRRSAHGRISQRSVGGKRARRQAPHRQRKGPAGELESLAPAPPIRCPAGSTGEPRTLYVLRWLVHVSVPSRAHLVTPAQP